MASVSRGLDMISLRKSAYLPTLIKTPVHSVPPTRYFFFFFFFFTFFRRFLFQRLPPRRRVGFGAVFILGIFFFSSSFYVRPINDLFEQRYGIPVHTISVRGLWITKATRKRSGVPLWRVIICII